jgi:hypothetical protein
MTNTLSDIPLKIRRLIPYLRNVNKIIYVAYLIRKITDIIW